MDVHVYQGLLEFNWNLLFSAVTVLALYAILKHFFFEKVHFFMMARKAHIEEELAVAAKTHRDAEVLLAEYSRTLASAEEEKRQIIREARQIAEERAQAMVDEAKAQATEMVKVAHKKIALEEEKAVVLLKKEIADLAVLAAEQILEREVDGDGHSCIVDQILEEAAREPATETGREAAKEAASKAKKEASKAAKEATKAATEAATEAASEA